MEVIPARPQVSESRRTYPTGFCTLRLGGYRGAMLVHAEDRVVVAGQLQLVPELFRDSIRRPAAPPGFTCIGILGWGLPS